MPHEVRLGSTVEMLASAKHAGSRGITTADRYPTPAIADVYELLSILRRTVQHDKVHGTFESEDV